MDLAGRAWLMLGEFLVVRLDEIGDVVLTSPFLRELRRNAPTAWITLVVKPSVRNIVELCPYVNEVLAYDGGPPDLSAAVRRKRDAIQFAVRRLWRRRFDLAFIPRFDTDYYHATFLAFLSGAPRLVGYAESVTRDKADANRGYDCLLADALPKRGVKHEVTRPLDLLRALGGDVKEDQLELWLSGADRDHAHQLLARDRVGRQGVLIALGVGAGAPSRAWPLPNFIELARRLARTIPAEFVIIGSAKDQVRGRELRSQLGEAVCDCCGQTTLREAAALIGQATAYVGNDTGLMHMAAASKTPVVEVSCHPLNGPAGHPRSPVRFGPWHVSSMVVQPAHALPPCSGSCEADEAHCVSAVAPEQVENAVTLILGKAAALHALFIIGMLGLGWAVQSWPATVVLT